MRILLDTHCWLWSIAAPERFRKEARSLLADRGNILYLSAASAWEISIKVGLGKLRLPGPPEQFVPERLERDRVEPLPIELVHALRVTALPHHHRDPFDRVLIAQAQIERLPILTADPQFEAYEVELVRAR